MMLWIVLLSVAFVSCRMVVAMLVRRRFRGESLVHLARGFIGIVGTLAALQWPSVFFFFMAAKSSLRSQ